MSRINFDRISKAVYYFDNIPVGYFDDGKCEDFEKGGHEGYKQTEEILKESD